jgi:hypothetical protein
MVFVVRRLVLKDKNGGKAGEGQLYEELEGNTDEKRTYKVGLLAVCGVGYDRVLCAKGWQHGLWPGLIRALGRVCVVV